MDKEEIFKLIRELRTEKININQEIAIHNKPKHIRKAQIEKEIKYYVRQLEK